MSATTAPFTGSVNGDVLTFASAVVQNVSTLGGNDEITLNGGVNAAITVDADTGDDVLRLNSGVMAASATIDLQAGADTLILNADLSAIPTINLGSADGVKDRVEVDVLQTLTLTISEWGTEDVLDLSGLSDVSSFAVTSGAALVAHGVQFTSGTGSVTVTLDATGDTSADMTIVLDGVTSLTTNNILL